MQNFVPWWQRSQWLQVLAGSLADLQVDFPDRAQVWLAYVQGLDVESLPEAASDRERLYLTNRGIVSGYHNIRANEARLCSPFERPSKVSWWGPKSNPDRWFEQDSLSVLTGTFEVKSAIHARHLPFEGDDVQLRDETGRWFQRGPHFRDTRPPKARVKFKLCVTVAF